MSRLFAVIENEQGKRASKAGNEYLDIDIKAGNAYIARLTVREGEDGHVHVYDELDRELMSTAVCAYCKEPMYTTIQAHHHTERVNGIEQDVTRCASGHKQDDDGRCPCTNRDGK